MLLPVSMTNALSVFSVTLLLGVAFMDFGRSAPQDEHVDESPGDNELGDVSFVADIPPTWEVVTANANARGWKMTGFAKCPLTEVESEVVKIMDGHGLSLTHRVDDDESAQSVLIEFASKDGAKVMWMLWHRPRGETGFSWGISK